MQTNVHCLVCNCSQLARIQSYIRYVRHSAANKSKSIYRALVINRLAAAATNALYTVSVLKFYDMTEPRTGG